MQFRDRSDAGRQLAEKLSHYKRGDIVVYAIPRGGIIVASEIAKALSAPLDLVIVRKVGYPANPEYAVCVVTDNSAVICNEKQAAQVGKKILQTLIAKERIEAKRRHKAYLQNRQPISCEGKTAILVDDGAATGLTFLAAVKELQGRQPKEIIAALPVLPKEAASEISATGATLVALAIPSFYLGSVGSYYDEFPQVTDEEVIAAL